MHSLRRIINLRINSKHKRNISIIATKCRSFTDMIDLSPEVKQGISDGKPIVALESTIITHGMPYPKNLECALDVEQIIRSQGAIPATIAIRSGRINVGLSEANLSVLAEKASTPGRTIKVSRRDLPYALSSEMDGGTTVAGTMIVAAKMGISIFVTGGIGGVHRKGHETMDVSADLVELGRTPVCVVSSGVKSILDIERTLEFLETHGVCVATYDTTNDFPAFYTRRSGFKSPYCVKSPLEAAKMIKASEDLELKSGILIAVPVPEAYSMDENLMEDAIKEALNKAEREGVKGKEVTPLILAAVAEITKGASLKTNMALIKNNAKIGAKIAVELHRLKQNHPSPGSELNLKILSSKDNPRSKDAGKISPVIIGGSNMDYTIKILDPEIKMNGTTHLAKVTRSWGGVGRNIAECLYRLGADPILLTALDETTNRSVEPFSLFECRSPPSNGHSNASYSAVLDHKGECRIGLGDMAIHDSITPQWILENRNVFKDTPLIVMDGNISIPTMECILDLAEELNKPVFFEPTDARKAIKPFKTKSWKSIKYITPNLNELYAICSLLGYKAKIIIIRRPF